MIFSFIHHVSEYHVIQTTFIPIVFRGFSIYASDCFTDSSRVAPYQQYPLRCGFVERHLYFTDVSECHVDKVVTCCQSAYYIPPPPHNRIIIIIIYFQFQESTKSSSVSNRAPFEAFHLMLSIDQQGSCIVMLRGGMGLAPRDAFFSTQRNETFT